jgi:hypothetical protein
MFRIVPAHKKEIVQPDEEADHSGGRPPEPMRSDIPRKLLLHDWNLAVRLLSPPVRM